MSTARTWQILRAFAYHVTIAPPGTMGRDVLADSAVPSDPRGGDSTMRLILTNDDGIDAPGLAALVRALAGLGELRIVAPSGPQSGCGHAVTTHCAIESRRRHDGAIAVSGTPADCVRVALHHLATGADWVISGINSGGNLGADLTISGTVAAAREAAFHGVPSVAISQYIAKGRPVDWQATSDLAAKVLRDILARPSVPGSFWNVNLPHPALEEGAVECPVDTSPLPLSYRVEGDRAHYAGDYHDRPRRPGSDVAVCFGGRVSLSRVTLGG